MVNYDMGNFLLLKVSFKMNIENKEIEVGKVSG